MVNAALSFCTKLSFVIMSVTQQNSFQQIGNIVILDVLLFIMIMHL